MLDVAALGELLIDFTYQSADESGYPTMAAHPGGAPANFLAALAKLGARTALLGKVGADAFGDMLIGTLERAGIGTRGVIRSADVFTTLAFVTLDPSGDRTFSFARKPGADTCITAEELDLELIDCAKVFHFGTLSLTDEPARSATRRAVAYARERGKLITYDPNLRRPLWRSMEEAREQRLAFFVLGLSPEEGACRIMSEYGVKLVFVTCGAEGCVFRNQNAGGHVPGLSGLSVLDTTGAGDIFGGCAVWGLLRTGKAPEALTRGELERITAFACAVAGLSTTRAGGISSLFDREEIEKRILIL